MTGTGTRESRNKRSGIRDNGAKSWRMDEKLAFAFKVYKAGRFGYTIWRLAA